MRRASSLVISGAATWLFLEIDIGEAGIPVVKTHRRHHADFVSLYVAKSRKLSTVGGFISIASDNLSTVWCDW
jgi:hypothetical protein